jgi:flavin-dependent dehydrogenase
VTSGTGVAVRATFGPDAAGRALTGRALTRRDLDAALVARAIASGVEFQDGLRVRSALVEGASSTPRVHGVVLAHRSGHESRLRARLTIAADGRRSTLAFGLGLASQPRKPRRWAVGSYYAGVAGLGDVGEMHIRGRHYLGVAPMPDGQANVCLVSPARGGFDDPPALLDRVLKADPLLADRFAQAARVAPVTTLGPLAVDVRRCGVPGLLLAGDAAGFVDPMTGDGLRLAMRGAELAGDAALAWLDDPAVDAVALLSRARTSAFGRKLGVNRLLRRLVSSPRGVRLAAIGARLAPSALRRVIRYSGDVKTD